MAGWWFAILAGAALKSTLVLAAAWLAALALRRRSAAARHLIWTAAAAAVLALPFLAVWMPPLSVPTPAALADNLVFRITAAGLATASTPTSAAPAVPVNTPWHADWQLVALLGWAAGVSAALVQMAVGFAGIRRVRRAASLSPDSLLARDLARRVSVGREVAVFETFPGSMPMTFGVWRPVVFMPSDAAAWSEERRRMVLLHELAHVRRGDVATQLAARLALILHWWNPLAWVAWREFLKERERATDDLVLQAGARASDYASHLLEVARSMHDAPPLAWAHVAMARRSQLEGRLSAILDARVTRNRGGWAPALAAAVTAVLVVAPLAAVRAQANVLPLIRVSAPPPAPVNAAIPAPPPAIETKSSNYGLGLLKLAALEAERNRPGEAEAFYAKAGQVLGDRAEAAPALLFLGQSLLRRNQHAQALAYFQKAQQLDRTQTAYARMWMGLIHERRREFDAADLMYKSALAAAPAGSTQAATVRQMYSLFLNRQKREEDAQAIRPAPRLPATPTPGVLRVGGTVKPPALLFKKEPQYTEEARLAKFQGTVVLYIEVGPDGWAHNIQVTQGLGLGLDQRAVAAVSQWRFRPGMKDDVAVPVAATVEVNFRLL
jgi:TonB family protein